jgi:hypothetical protein
MRAWLLVALLVLPTAVGWAGARFFVGKASDECSLVCEHRLCLKRGAAKPSLRPCDDEAATMPDVVVRRVTGDILRLQLRGATARLGCWTPGAACDPRPACTSYTDCPPGLGCPQHLHVCGLTTTCPSPGYYPGAVLSDRKKEGLVAYSDPCSGLCEFRLCEVDATLVPCAADGVPGIVVRAPYLLASDGSEPPFVLKYGRRQRLALTCRPVGAPCWSCDTPDVCFTGGACVDGFCQTTALCQ